MYYTCSIRQNQLLDAGLRVLAAHGLRGLTHRAIDRAAGLPEGSASNDFRTRQALVAALAMHVATRRMAARDGASAGPAGRGACFRDGSSSQEPTSEEVTSAWFELLLEAGRNDDIAAAIRPMRERMIALLGSSRTDGLPLTDRQLAALLTGLEFAEYVTGEHMTDLALALLGQSDRTGTPNWDGD